VDIDKYDVIDVMEENGFWVYDVGLNHEDERVLWAASEVRLLHDLGIPVMSSAWFNKKTMDEKFLATHLFDKVRYVVAVNPDFGMVSFDYVLSIPK